MQRIMYELKSAHTGAGDGGGGRGWAAEPGGLFFSPPPPRPPNCPSSSRPPLAHLQRVPVYVYFVVYTLKPCK
jgi:hypothetical protein